VGRVLPHVLDDESLGELRLDVLARASFAVSTCADLEENRLLKDAILQLTKNKGAYFEIERAVDLVLLGASKDVRPS
jgi:hypothetical protein